MPQVLSFRSKILRNLNADGRYQIIVCIRQKGQKSQENVPELICDLEDEFEPIEDENDEKMIDLDQDISDTMPIFSLKSYLNPSIPLRKQQIRLIKMVLSKKRPF